MYDFLPSSFIPHPSSLKKPLARRNEQGAECCYAQTLEQELEWVLQQVLEFNQELGNACPIGGAVVG